MTGSCHGRILILAGGVVTGFAKIQAPTPHYFASARPPPPFHAPHRPTPRLSTRKGAGERCVVVTDTALPIESPSRPSVSPLPEGER